MTIVGSLVLSLACRGAMSPKSSADSGYGRYDSGSAWDQDGDADADTDTDSDTDTMPPETESDFFSLAPAPAPDFLLIANPDRDTVSRVTVPELEVITAPVGSEPQAVQLSSTYDVAITFNEGSDDASVLPTDTLEEIRVDLRPALDAMQLSPDGTWAIAFNSLDADDGEVGSTQSVKEASFVHLASATSTGLALGFQPRQLHFSDDGARAVFLGDAWLALVQLDVEPLDIQLVQIADDLLDPPDSEELLLNPAGTRALIRQRDNSRLVLVDLDALSTSTLPTGGTPSDLDMHPDGVHAVAVARGSSELWIYDLESPQAPRVVDMPEDETLGAVTFGPDEATPALLYSTVSGQSRFASWDLSDDSITVHPLPKPVVAVGLDPTGQTALFVHDDLDADDMDVAYDGKHGVTLVNTRTWLTNDYVLPAEPTQFAHSDDGAHGFLIMDREERLEVLDYGTLLMDDVELRSEPVHLGTLPGTSWAYVSQEHELGRLSLYDAATGTLKTMTGFELNAGIEIEEDR